ncbi:MAG: flippase-like domain-containing protein [Bacteroidales bacterium]|nr:flippase-like domain-containing protein [Candidatus Liminaster caballi]
MIRRHARTVLLVVCTLILALMVWKAGIGALLDNLFTMRWSLLLCVAVWLAVYVFNTLSWGTIIRIWQCPSAVPADRRPLSFMRLFRLTVSGYALNYITPFGLLGGEPYRVVELRKHLGTEAAASSVLLYAMMHVCSHVLFWLIGCVAAVWAVADIDTRLAAILWSVCGVCVMLLVVFYRCYSRGMVVRIVSAAQHLWLIGNTIGRWKARNIGRLTSIDNGVACLFIDHPRRFWCSLLLELVSRLVNVLEIAVILWWLCPHLQAGMLYADALVILAFSSLFANILFFSPMQMGTREGGIYLVIEMLGLAAAQTDLLPLAVSISFATRIREFVWIAIGIALLKMKE